MKKEKKQLKITPVKGRPMLHWVGKKALGVVQNFPAQLRERMGVKSAAAQPNYRAFMGDAGHNLLLHGDNLEVLANLLVGGFRGKVDLIYIDPPFDSGADYVRKVQLRGQAEAMTAEEQSAMEKVQYEDIWANDNYLQFMYERLILLRELLSERGSIYLHCDHHKVHHLRFLLDEIFGDDNFRNEIIWYYEDKFATGGKSLDKNHDTILHYSKGGGFIGREIRISKPKTTRRALREKVSGKTVDITNGNGEKVYVEYSDKTLDDVWTDIGRSIANGESTGYPTQKKSKLIERIMQYGSEDDSIVLDCFCGSGTTAAAAQRLGRRWIAADMNNGAIQTTTKRLGKMLAAENGKLGAKARGFAHYRVNNYDFQNEHLLRAAVMQKWGIQRDIADPFFDGVMNGELVKIAKFNKPLTRADVQLIRDELKNRPDEERNIALIGNGSETGLAEEAGKAQKRRAINRIAVLDIQQKGVFTFSPAQAKVEIAKRGKSASVKIADYISPTIMARMNWDESMFAKRIGDFRAQIDRVLWDSDYDGECFNIAGQDAPEKKSDLIDGEYEISLPRAGAKVAIKIVDMLGEETLTVK